MDVEEQLRDVRIVIVGTNVDGLALTALVDDFTTQIGRSHQASDLRLSHSVYVEERDTIGHAIAHVCTGEDVQVVLVASHTLLDQVCPYAAAYRDIRFVVFVGIDYKPARPELRLTSRRRMREQTRLGLPLVVWRGRDLGPKWFTALVAD